MAGPGEVTRDTLLRGRLALTQPRVGYRTNVDALLLASFATRDRPAARALDLGAGVGAVGLALVLRGGARRATLLEIDPHLVALARSNAIDSQLGDRVEAIEGDVRARLDASLAHAFDLVVANPPYAIEGATTEAHPARARSRIGEVGLLDAFAKTARAALGKAGRACIVYPARALVEAITALRAVGLEPKRMRMVHPLADRAAEVVLLEAKPARPGGLRVDRPLVMMRAPGELTDEARAIVE